MLVACSASLFVSFMSFRCTANFCVDEKANPKKSSQKKHGKASNMHAVFKMGFPCTSETISEEQQECSTPGVRHIVIQTLLAWLGMFDAASISRLNFLSHFSEIFCVNKNGSIFDHNFVTVRVLSDCYLHKSPRFASNNAGQICLQTKFPFRQGFSPGF